jgi:hypothetical protein
MQGHHLAQLLGTSGGVPPPDGAERGQPVSTADRGLPPGPVDGPLLCCVADGELTLPVSAFSDHIATNRWKFVPCADHPVAAGGCQDRCNDCVMFR